MSRKDIHQDGDYMPTPVGSHLYVWSKGGLRPNGDRGCVITSHGMDVSRNHMIRAGHPKPEVPLYFYCPHEYGLPDNSVEGVMTRRTKWYERVPSGASDHDYLLTKAQGSHSAVKDHETYGHIQKGFHPAGRRERAAKGYRAELESALGKAIPAVRIGMVRNAQAAYKADLERISDVLLDVVTIRHRRGVFSGQVTLFSAVRLLEKHGFHYSEIHCNFCRGPKTGHRMELNQGA